MSFGRPTEWFDAPATGPLEPIRVDAGGLVEDFVVKLDLDSWARCEGREPPPPGFPCWIALPELTEGKS